MTEEVKNLSKEELMELTRTILSPLSPIFHMEMHQLIDDGVEAQDVLRIGQAVLSVLTCTFIDFIFQKDAPLQEKHMFCEMLHKGIKENLSAKQFMCKESDTKH